MRTAALAGLALLALAAAVLLSGAGATGEDVAAGGGGGEMDPASRRTIQAADAPPSREDIPFVVEKPADGDTRPAEAPDPLAALRRCVQERQATPPGDVSACFEGLDYAAVTRADVAEFLQAGHGGALLLKGYLHRLEPGSALAELHAVSALTGDGWRIYERMAAALHLLAEDDPPWVDTFASLLAGPDLFGAGGTRNEIEIAGLLAASRPELRALLLSGARGEWGGSRQQVGQAYWVLGRPARHEDTESFLALVDPVLASPHLDAANGYSVAQLMLGDLMLHCAEHPAAVDEVTRRIEQLLDDPDFSIATAAQLHGQGFIFGSERVVSDAEAQRLQQRAADILVARYGPQYLEQ